MSQTDVSGVAEAVSGISIEGPGTASENPVETTFEITNAQGVTVIPPTPVSVLADAVASLPSPGRNVELFDKSAYLDAPMIDGQAADQIVVSFSGSIKWDALDPQGRMMFEKLTLGKSVTLRVEGAVAKKHGAWKLAGKEGEEQEVVTGQCSVKVTDLFMLSPEDL